jgi:hypothetical protein
MYNDDNATETRDRQMTLLTNRFAAMRMCNMYAAMTEAAKDVLLVSDYKQHKRNAQEHIACCEDDMSAYDEDATKYAISLLTKQINEIIA